MPAIIFEMLDDMTSPKANDRTLALVGLYYTYLAPVMPPTVYEYLQRKIVSVIEALQGTRPFPHWLDVPQTYRAGVLQALRKWHGDIVDAFSVRSIRKLIRKFREQDRMRQLMHGTPGFPIPKGCEREDGIYKASKVLVLRPNTAGNNLIEADVWKALEAFEKSGLDVRKSAEFTDLVDKTWKPNVTMIDPELDLKLENIDIQASVGENPLNMANGLQNAGLVDPGLTRGKGSLGQVRQWFQMAAKAIGEARHKIKVEAIAGDVMTILKQITDGTVGSW